MSDDFVDLLSSISDGYLSPSLPDWAAGSADGLDNLNFDLDSLHLSTVDFLASAVTATRNGNSTELSSVSQFAAILAQTGIHGPWSLKSWYNLSSRATKIGEGGQFTVFKEKPGPGPSMHEGLVMKRVKVPLSSQKGDLQFAAGPEYRKQLRTLALEVLALCNPMLRQHPNIVRLAAWGYDYPYADMPVPVLFVEAALMPLTDFLVSGDKCSVDVKYQFSLDVANGVEALHDLRIVHGDLKPDNVLVFRTQSDKVPFRAKLSDFGVCIDLENSENGLTMDDYNGTPGWVAPEVESKDLSRFCSFTPDLMFHFDAYSYGMTVLSIFVNAGKPVTLGDASAAAGSISEMLIMQDDIPSAMRMELRKALQKLLAEDPRNRPLPTPQLLRTDTAAYASWLYLFHVEARGERRTGTIDPTHNRGPLFWYRLAPSVLAELEAQYKAFKAGGTELPGSALLGMAQAITGAKPSYLDRLVSYITDAATGGYSPAWAIYAQILTAHGEQPEVGPEELEQWLYQAVSEGYLFAPKDSLSPQRLEQALGIFRSNGGFYTDPFLEKANVVEACRSAERALQWKSKYGHYVDRIGNTLLHAAAALGASTTVTKLVEDGEIKINVENDNGETPLYKACQAGHAGVIELLLDLGADASRTTHHTKITPLHWLFILPDSSISHIASKLISAGANVNAVIHPTVGENTDGFWHRVQITHYPFELPHGTSLHWAAFFRNLTAVDALINLGLNVDATYYEADNATTPLALAAWYGDLEVAEHLIKRGADGTLTDSKGHNMLHMMTLDSPKYHGFVMQSWHSWIRHGNWDSHLSQTTKLVQLLVDAGADLNGKSKIYPRPTPIALAATLGVWNGAVISALIDAGAEVDRATISAGDSILHCWASIIGPRLSYPGAEYIPTLRRIVSAISIIDVRNDFGQETPLHTLAATYHTEDEFEEACEILLAHDPPAAINAQTRRGATPLSIALTSDDPTRRGLFLLKKGSSPLPLNDQGRDAFYNVVNNTMLPDQETYDLIIAILERIKTKSMDIPHEKDSIHTIYQNFFLSNPGAIQTLIASIARGKLQTTILLLSLGLNTRINDTNPDKARPYTPLDQTLHSAELARREHMEKLSLYKPGPGRRVAIEANLVYDDSQGPPARAAEAYHDFPQIIRYLRENGAKRQCEVELDESGHTAFDQTANMPPDLDGTYVEQPGFWDWTAIYTYGFTPSTQPNLEKWQILYDLASYPSGWLEEQVDELGTMYEMGDWRPDVRFFEEAEQGFIRAVVRKIGGIANTKDHDDGGDDNSPEPGGVKVRLFAIDPDLGHVEVVVMEERIIEKERVTMETSIGI
ncbi:ankyrin repeat protein [Aspergillus venezuelensis]